MPSISFLNHLGALLTLWLLLCCGAPAAENGRILMVTEATFPPYEFRDGNAILGIDPEIMREVARRTGRELVIEDMSFDSVITAVVSGKADVAASGITVTPERRRKVDFSIPYVEAAQVIIVPKGSPIRKREDIRGKRIGVQHGATGDIYVTRNIQQPERFPNGALAVAAVAAGKVDAAVIDQDPATMYVAGNDRLEILPEPLTSESYAIAVRKGDTALLQDINGTIAALKASGKLEEIRNAYAAMQVKSAAGPEQHASGGGWLENTWLNLKESFYVNFMQEGRWKYLSNGFLVTVEVSFFPFCWAFWLALWWPSSAPRMTNGQSPFPECPLQTVPDSHPRHAGGRSTAHDLFCHLRLRGCQQSVGGRGGLRLQLRRLCGGNHQRRHHVY